MRSANPLLIGLVLGLALAVGLVISPRAGHTQPGPLHYACYGIVAEGPSDPFPSTAYVDTQFGDEELVDILGPYALCAPALKNGMGELTEPHLKCYDISGGADPPDVVDLQTQFGWDYGVEVGPPQFLCMGAVKEFYPGEPQPPWANLHYVCYTLPTTTEDPDVSVSVETQFGFDQSTEVGAAELLCAPATKDGVGSPTDAPHFKCYNAPVPLEYQYPVVNLLTQWGLETLVWVLDETYLPETLLCTEAVKVHPGPVADKAVEDILFHDATGLLIPDNHMEVDASDGSQQDIVSVTSEDWLIEGEPPDDSWVGFYADIPDGCYGYWLPSDPARDTRTTGGDPLAYPDEIPDPDQMGTEVSWQDDKEIGLDPPYPDTPFEADIHFQTLDYDLHEELGAPLYLSRDFQFHCDEPSTHTFTFCNKIEPKPPWEDPDIVDPGLWPGDNVRCEDLTVEVWAEVDVQDGGPAGEPGMEVFDDDCASPPPASIATDQDEDLCLVKTWTQIGPYTVSVGFDLSVVPPVGCTLPVDPSGSYGISPPQPPGMHSVGLPFTINCSEEGNKSFAFDNDWNLNPEPHVTDPDLTNNHGDLDWAIDVEAPEPHYACFNTSNLGPTLDPDVPVNLKTQFGEELDLDLGDGDFLCPPAIKYREGGPPEGEGTLDAPHLRCFDIVDEPPLNQLVNLTTQFGEYLDVPVLQPWQLCAPTSKQVFYPYEGPFYPGAEEPHYKWYWLDPEGLPPVEESVIVNTQFFLEPEYVDVVSPPLVLGVPAGKGLDQTIPDVIPDAPHLVCYYAEMIPTGGAPEYPYYAVNLETQFGPEWEIGVDRGYWLCVPAEKELACIDRLGDTQCDDPVNDPDDDGCADWEELAGAPDPKPGHTGAYDPNAWYDFYDVPVPAKPDSGPGSGANGTRDRAVAMDDVLAVLFYVGTYDGDAGDPNPNGVEYDTIKGVDSDGDTTNDIPPPLHQIKEGVKYDRSAGPVPNPPWEVGPPDGAVSMDDVLANLAQVGLQCTGGPNPD